MSNSLTSNYLMMSVMRHMWDFESIYRGKGQARDRQGTGWRKVSLRDRISE